MLYEVITSNLINACYRRVGLKETVIFADQLMYMGFSCATRAAVSFGINDMTIPESKAGILGTAEDEVLEIENQYTSGLVTMGERYNKVVDIWSRTNDQVAKAMIRITSYNVCYTKLLRSRATAVSSSI